jgi:hypothetical protein
MFESPDDARNAIQQFNGYDWQGRLLEVREDRYANAGGPMGGFGGRGGFGGMRGGFGGGFGGRGGFGAGRGGFGGGFGGRGGFGGGFDPAPPAGPGQSAPPNPFTDFATAGTDKSEIIYVRNVSQCFHVAVTATTMLTLLASLVNLQRRPGRTLHYDRQGGTG